MSTHDYQLRPYQESDLPEMRRVYRDAIRSAGGQYYRADQIAAWASFADDVAAFGKWIAGASTYVAVDKSGGCLGFGGWQSHGRISALFVAPAAMRRGIGTALLERLLAEIKSHGFAEVTTEASEFSRPLFEKFGFTVTKLERNEVRGVAIPRYAMKWRQPPPARDIPDTA